MMRADLEKGLSGSRRFDLWGIFWSGKASLVDRDLQWAALVAKSGTHDTDLGPRYRRIEPTSVKAHW